MIYVLLGEREKKRFTKVFTKVFDAVIVESAKAGYTVSNGDTIGTANTAFWKART